MTPVEGKGKLTDKSDLKQMRQLREETSRKLDQFDLNNELAGNETGRIRRFLSENDERTPRGREKKRRQEAERTLQKLLLNIQYRQLYFKVEEQLIKAENTARQALDLIVNITSKSNSELADMHSKAAHLPDGTAFFYDSATGDFYTENGIVLTANEISNITIPDDAPAWKDYKAARQSNQLLRDYKEQIEADQRNVIAPIRQRLNDQDNPPSKDELNDMLVQLEEVKSSHDAVIDKFANHQQPPHFDSLTAAKDILGKSSINGPPVYDAFNGASSDSANLEPSTPEPDEVDNNKNTVRFDIPDL
ncbi:MAG: hypothetical protein V3T17_14165 [Pseudomonadales bacterium]